MGNAAVDTKYNKIIIALSIIIPLTVALLFRYKLSDFGIQVEPMTFLPPIYATLNGITSLCLVFGLIAIKNGKQLIHQTFMTSAVLFSALFLVMYVLYHMTSDSTPYGGQGASLWIYRFILVTHIILSIVVIPLVLFTYVRALAKRFDKHQKLARITYPIWLYVAVTGVIVYIMISPYYAK